MAKSASLEPNPKRDALRKEAEKWLERIRDAEKEEAAWIDDANKAVSIYTGEGGRTGEATRGEEAPFDFNILYANVETIVPAIINSPPAPDIRRRWGQDDPVARDLAEVIERAIRVQVDDGRLQTEMEAMAQDGFLAGRGLIRLRFKSDFEKSEDLDDLKEAEEKDEPSGAKGDDADDKEDVATDSPPTDNERTVNERICFEAVSWRDLRRGKAKRWDDVPWIAFRHCIYSEDYDDFADKELLDAQINPDKSNEVDAEDERTVWEVWDKRSKRVKFIRETGVKIIKDIADPLKLTRFFPIHEPVQAITLNGRLTPVNPFSIYRKLADELDKTTRRIRVITEQLKLKGWYAGESSNLQTLLNAEDNEFVPIADPEMWAANGGLQGAILFWPVEKLVAVLAQLFQVREQTKQAIYEITGISDIIRGASRSSETATAQNIKSQWGSLRIQTMQRMMERAARDLFVMMSEIIPTKFSPETLQRITGIQIVPSEEDQTATPQPQQPMPPQIPPGAPPEMAQQAQAQFEQAQQQFTQQMQEWQQAEQARQDKLQRLAALQEMMKEPVSSYYRIDVESDSTVKADLTRQKAEATGFLQASSQFFAAVGPLVQQGAIPAKTAVEIYSSFARLYNLGKSVEDALDELLVQAREGQGSQGQPEQPQEPTEEQKAAQEAAKAEMEAKLKQEQAKAARYEAEAQTAQVDQAVKQADLGVKRNSLSLSEMDVVLKRAQLGSLGLLPPMGGQPQPM